MSKRETAWEVRKELLLPECGMRGGNCKEIVIVDVLCLSC